MSAEFIFLNWALYIFCISFFWQFIIYSFIYLFYKDISLYLIGNKENGPSSQIIRQFEECKCADLRAIVLRYVAWLSVGLNGFGELYPLLPTFICKVG